MEIINNTFNRLTSTEARSVIINSSPLLKICVAGPTNAGKSTLVHNLQPATIEAYFTKGEELNSRFYASSDPFTWDNPDYYDISRFIFDWRSMILKGVGEQSPIMPLQIEPATRRFYRDNTAQTEVNQSHPYLCDIFLPQTVNQLVDQGLIDQLYLIDSGGFLLGQNSRLARRMLRQSSGNCYFDLGTIALGNIFNADAFQMLFKKAESGEIGLPVTVVDNPLQREEVDLFVQKNQSRLLSNGANILFEKVSTPELFSTQEWAIVTEDGINYQLRVFGEDLDIEIPLRDYNKHPIGSGDLMKLFDMIYNYQQYQYSEVLAVMQKIHILKYANI